MRIDKLYLSDFKNYHELEIDFSEKINIFTGPNGAGKTNILDALHYLSFCKSFFNPIDSQNIRHDKTFFAIKGYYSNQNNNQDMVLCSMKRNEKKKFSINKKEYDRFADHIGVYPLVIISPADTQMIYEGGEERRRYMDSVISQFDRNYLETLITYNKVLQQRNASLKQFSHNQTLDEDILSIWDEQLIKSGESIFQSRKTFLDNFIPVMSEYYRFVCEGKESVNIEYRSQLTDNNFKDLLLMNRRKDLAFGYSTVGIHRDDINFMIDHFPIKKFGSQGQQKSFLISLKLAQFDYTYKKKGYKPILLLDDIFDKLDNNRVQQLMKLVSRNEFGQIFITDTHRERIELVFNEIGVETKIFNIHNGELI